MPIFEYQCEACGKKFEQLVRSSAEKPAGCPKCGGKKLSKQFSSFSAPVAQPSFDSPCASGSCNTGSCSTGACPFSK